MRGFGQTPTYGRDAKYYESVAEDNRRSEQLAAKHRQQSEALKNKPQRYSMPAYAKGPAKNPAANVGGNMAASLDPAFMDQLLGKMDIKIQTRLKSNRLKHRVNR